MTDSVNQIFMKVIALNLILVGLFAVVVSAIAIYKRKYDDKNQINRLYLYLVGGALLVVIGAFIYK